MTESAKVTGAEYDPEDGRIEYTFETSDGKAGTATMSDCPWGPGIEMSGDAMKQLADALPGTPLYDRTDGGAFDPETVPPIGFNPDL